MPCSTPSLAEWSPCLYFLAEWRSLRCGVGEDNVSFMHFLSALLGLEALQSFSGAPQRSGLRPGKISSSNTKASRVLRNVHHDTMSRFLVSKTRQAR